MKKLLLVIFALALPFITTGCASITGTENQSVSVQTHGQSGTEVVGASCELTNNKGKWFVTTPGSVNIHRSNDDMQVICKKESLENGRAAVVSDTKGSMFGNILFGGGIGAIVDHNKGTAYEYPTLIDIVMGGFATIKTTHGQSGPQSSPQPSKSSITSQQAAAQTNTTTVAPTRSETTAQTLRDLQALREDRVITETEYQTKKQQLLEKL